MNVSSMLGRLFRPGSAEGRSAAEFLESEQPIRLPPRLAADELPPEFESVLQVQVLGYREGLTILNGYRLHVLDPIWTLVPKDG